MIKLDVAAYCQDCPHFYPDCAKIDFIDGLEVRSETTVFCQNREECRYAIYMNDKLMGKTMMEHEKEGIT